MQVYTWNNYRCTYEVYPSSDNIPLLLIHPIGVGLSHHFWDRFCQEWLKSGHTNPIYSPDLLGCGESDMPHVAYTPNDWAEQLQYFLQTVVQKPVILIVQGALLPVAIALNKLQTEPNLIRGFILAGPPPFSLISENSSTLQQKFRWNLLDAVLGTPFYRYARTEKFLRSFSIKQLFADENAVDREWLDTLQLGASNLESRHAVFSFLAGFWRQDYQQAIAAISQPTLILMGEKSSSIARSGKRDTPNERLADYLQCFPNAKGITIPGRNVLPYESTAKFVDAIAPFIKECF